MEFKQMFAASAVALASLGGLVAPSTALAASQDECAIWICLPGGFPSGCGAAHSAMMDRIKDRKSPLPSFGSCAVKEEGHSEMSYKHGMAAYYPTRRVCTSWGYGEGDSCNQWETVPGHWVKNKWCSMGGETDYDGCTKSGRFVEVYIDGKQAGSTYYW